MSLKSPLDMTPEQLSMALQNIKTIENWIHAVKAHAFEILESGGSIPGYRLGFGVKHRIWKPGEEDRLVRALVPILESAGVSKDTLYTTPELLSPAEMEKLLKTHGAWPKKRRNEPKEPTPIDPFVDYSMPKPAVLPVTSRDGESENEFGTQLD